MVEGDLTTVVESKVSTKKWHFTLRTTKLLKVVALLYDSHRSHFSLVRISTSKGKKTLLNDEPINNQEWTSRLDLNDEKQKLTHTVEVSFSTKLYGTFRQTVLFDFGSEPFLVKHLCVDVVPVNDAEKMKEMQQVVFIDTFKLSVLGCWGENLEVLVASDIDRVVISHGDVSGKDLLHRV